MSQPWGRFLAALDRRMSGESLAVFRVVVGVALAAQAVRLVLPAEGSWLWRTLTGPHVEWQLRFPGLEWLAPWPEPWMTRELWLIGALGALLALGLCSRLAAGLLAAAWTHVWLLDPPSFDAHDYLFSLLALLLAFMPSDRRLSVAALVRRWRGRRPSGGGVPAWAVHLLRAQLVIVHVFGGLSRLTRELLVDAQPVRYFLEHARVLGDLQGRASPELLESLRAALASEPVVRAAAYGGVAFDLLVGPLLLVRRTRFMALALALAVHAARYGLVLSDPGILPVLAAGCLLIFLDADWPSRLGSWIRRPRVSRPDWRWALPGLVLLPPFGLLLGWRPEPSASVPVTEEAPGWPRVRGVLVAAWLVLQVLLPVRPWIVAGNANWSGEGTQYAWRATRSVRSRDLHALWVDDPQLVVRPSADPATIRWDAWPGMRSIFLHVPAEDIPWEKLPPLVLIREPLVGERFVYNAESRIAPYDVYENMTVLPGLWEDAHERAATFTPTISLRVALAQLEAATAQWGEDAPYLDHLRRIRAHLAALDAGGISEHERFARTRRILHDLGELLDSETHGAAVDRALQSCHPFELLGAPAPEKTAFLAIEDPELFLTKGHHRIMQRNVVRAFWPDPALVLVDLRRLGPEDWALLPQSFPVRQGDGGLRFLWNFNVDPIGDARRRWVAVHPSGLRQYAERVTGIWEQTIGNRPEVHARFYVSVDLAEPRLLTDPSANLLEARFRRFSRTPWILPEDDYPPPADAALGY